MGSQAEINQGRLTTGLAGTDPPGRETYQPIWDAWNARDPDTQARDSLAVNEHLVERFEDLSDEELGGMRLSIFGMQLDGPGLARLILGEHAFHTWDIAVTRDPTAGLAPDAAAVLLDTLPMFAGFAGKPANKRFTVRVRTVEPSGDFGLSVVDKVALTRGDCGPADGELRLAAETLLRLVFGRLDPQHTPPVTLTGVVTLDDLRRIFPGV